MGFSNKLIYKTMSWDAYAAEMTKDGYCFGAGVFGLDGSTWAVQGMSVTAHEVKVPNLETGGEDTNQINEQAELAGTSMTTVSLWLNGEKYQVVSTNEVSNALYLRSGNKGGCVALCAQCKLVGL